MQGLFGHSSSEVGWCGRREDNPPADPIRCPFTYRKPYHSHLAGRECRSLARTHWHRLGCKTHRRTESGQRQAQVAEYRGRWGPGGASRKPCTCMAASFLIQHSARRSGCAALESSCRVSHAFSSAVTEQVTRQPCLSSRFGMIGQRLPAANESVRFITVTFTSPGFGCK